MSSSHADIHPLSSSIPTPKRKKNLTVDDIQQHVHHDSKLFGEGDSWYKELLFSPNESIEILRQLDEQIIYLPREQFKFKIFNTINLLPRDKAFYGNVHSDGSCKYLIHSSLFRKTLKKYFFELNRSTLSL